MPHPLPEAFRKTMEITTIEGQPVVEFRIPCMDGTTESVVAVRNPDSLDISFYSSYGEPDEEELYALVAPPKMSAEEIEIFLSEQHLYLAAVEKLLKGELADRLETARNKQAAKVDKLTERLRKRFGEISGEDPSADAPGGINYNWSEVASYLVEGE